MSYDIIPYNPEHRDAVAQLWRGLWGRDTELNRRLVKWRHEDNPFGGPPMLFLAMQDGEVIASRGAYASRWTAGIGNDSRTVDLGCAGDTMILPDYRQKGLLQTLTETIENEARARGQQHLLNLSASEPIYINSIISGWRSIGTWPTLIRSRTSPAPEGSAPEPDNDANAATVFSQFDANAQAHRGAVSQEVHLVEHPDPAIMAELAGRSDKGGRIRHVKDAAYLAWRLANPRCTYRCLQFGRERPEGYLLLQATNTARKNNVRVVDMETPNGTIQAELLRAVIEWGDFPTTQIWWLRLPRAVLQMLADAGFEGNTPGTTASRHLPTVLIRHLCDPAEPDAWHIGGIHMLQLGNWDIRMLHSDAT